MVTRDTIPTSLSGCECVVQSKEGEDAIESSTERKRGKVRKRAASTATMMAVNPTIRLVCGKADGTTLVKDVPLSATELKRAA